MTIYTLFSAAIPDEKIPILTAIFFFFTSCTCSEIFLKQFSFNVNVKICNVVIKIYWIYCIVTKRFKITETLVNCFFLSLSTTELLISQIRAVLVVKRKERSVWSCTHADTHGVCLLKALKVYQNKKASLGITKHFRQVFQTGLWCTWRSGEKIPI